MKLETFVKHSSYLFYSLLLGKGKNFKGPISQTFMALLIIFNM